MFRLVTSNNAATLANELGRRLSTPCANPLQPARVLVPQAGLRRWLQAYLAEHLGVLANVEFTPPAQFAWELLRAARPELPRQSPFDVEVLRWHLYALLGGRLDGAALAPLRDYSDGDGDPLRRYALSFELARAYERMQGYRRERLLRWEHSGSSQGADRDDWQAELWRRLLPRVGGASRAARVDDWLRRFDPEYARDAYADKPAPPGLPTHFACFACANVSPDVLRMLSVAGRHCDVDFLLPLPSSEYLGDTPTRRHEVWEWLRGKSDGNPLIISQGGALAAFVELLYGYEHVRPDKEIEDFDPEIDRATLLGRVRDDILKHAAPLHDDNREPLPDASLQFHACHTPLREVQVLHDALLAMFDADATLQPRDVAVMMPDVAAYAAAIDAVFGGIERNDPRWLPFNLGDLGAAALHPSVQLFLGLLDAPTSRWEVDTLLDVLAAPGVMRRFDLDADALDQLSRRVRAAGVRWGEDEHARSDCGDYREFSWAFGIDRMLAGFACGDHEDALVGGVAPLAGVEGAAFAHLDAVLAVTATWRHLRELSRRRQTASAWQDALNHVLDRLYLADPGDTGENRALERVRGALALLARNCGDADPGLELPWGEVRAFLRDTLAGADPRQFLFTGGVTFCGMVPLRVVPFRVICLLGMDAAAFPRREASGLDPLLAERRAGQPQRGDRDVRADDRLLFLQLLAAARDTFYVSWLGRDPHSNEDRPPSVVVSELIDLLRQGYLAPPDTGAATDARDARLPQREPLHPFAASLFGGDANPPRSYHAAWLPAARAPTRARDGLAPFVGQAVPTAGTTEAEISLGELKRFLGDPARGFLEAALRMVLPRGADENADLEPLQPDAPLLRYQLATALLAHGDTGAEEARCLLRAQGRLPPGELGTAALTIARERVALLRGAIDHFTGGTQPGADIAATLQLGDGTRLVGSVGLVHAAGLVRASAGKLNGKRALEAWVDALFATVATAAPRTCRLFWIDGDVARHCDLDVPTPAEACERLDALVAAMRRGLCMPLPLFPQASWQALRRWRVRKGEADHAEFVAHFSEAADAGDAFAPGSDFDRPAVRVAWRGVDLAAPDPHAADALYTTAIALLPPLRPAPAAKAKP